MKKRVYILVIIGLSGFLHLVWMWFFYTKFGSHAVVTREIWYYYGILKRIWLLPLFDPTSWLLSMISLLPQEYWLIGLSILSAILSTLTACLIFIMGSRLGNLNLGLIAGLIYTSMHGPLTESTANFTHDLTLIPLMLIVILMGIIVKKKQSGFNALAFIILMIVSIVGLTIGAFQIIMGLLVVSLYLWVTHRNVKMQPWIIFGLFSILVFIRIFFLSPILTRINWLSETIRGISLFDQIRAQSGDLLPVTMHTLFSRYGLWLIPAIIGFGLIFKKKDWLNLILLLFGLILCSLFSRALRILDIEVALLCAYALSYKKDFMYPALVGLCLFSQLVSWRYLRANTSEAEYQIFKKINQISKPGEKILVTWHDGYMVEAISHLKPTATPANIDFELPKVYWKSEEEAYSILKKEGISLIFVANRYFGIKGVNFLNDSFYYAGDGSLIYQPEEAGIIKFSQLQQTFLFRLMDEPAKVKFFTLLLEMQDRFSSSWLRIYRLKNNH